MVTVPIHFMTFIMSMPILLVLTGGGGDSDGGGDTALSCLESGLEMIKRREREAESKRLGRGR